MASSSPAPYADYAFVLPPTRTIPAAPVDQKELWEAQHRERAREVQELEQTPNAFAQKCAPLFAPGSTILEVGAGNGRDARFFARERQCRVLALDFSEEALLQLEESSRRDGTHHLVQPVLHNAAHDHLPVQEKLEGVYARSSLHLSNPELARFIGQIRRLLHHRGYLMVEGKTPEDEKIQRSQPAGDYLHVDEEGHMRRSWDEQSILNLCDEHDLELIDICRTTEYIRTRATSFIHFIAQKI